MFRSIEAPCIQFLPGQTYPNSAQPEHVSLTSHTVK